MVLCALPKAKVTQRTISRRMSAFLGGAPLASFQLYPRPVAGMLHAMRWSGGTVLISIVIVGSAFNSPSAEPNWAGEYADKNFLNGQAVFELTIEQSGNAVQVSFDAGFFDAHGAAPDGEGPARITGKNKLAFNWEDSFHNLGTGTITRASAGIVVSMKTTHLVESRCLMFYGQNMRLKRVK